MKNKVFVFASVERGAIDQFMWRPINFDIYSNLFHDIILESVADYIGQDGYYELLMVHEIERDEFTITAEYFETVHAEYSVDGDFAIPQQQSTT